MRTIRIEYGKYCKMVQAANKMFEEDRIGFYDMKTEKDGKYRKPIVGLNWGGFGTVSTEEAEKHMEAMRSAIRVANMINSLRIAYYYDDDEAEQVDWYKLEWMVRNAFEFDDIYELRMAVEGKEAES